jgi:hypothetical protein
MIKPNDLKILSVEIEDYDKIFEYTEKNFSKNRYNSDTVKSTWINPGKALNPNFTGILGEWVLNSDNDQNLEVEQFLSERPLVSDAGDGMAYPFCYPRAIPHAGLKPFPNLLCRGFKRITALTMKDRNFNI